MSFRKEKATRKQLALVAGFYQRTALEAMIAEDSKLPELLAAFVKAVTDKSHREPGSKVFRDGDVPVPVTPAMRAIMGAPDSDQLNELLETHGPDIIDLSMMAQVSLKVGVLSRRDAEQAAA